MSLPCPTSGHSAERCCVLISAAGSLASPGLIARVLNLHEGFLSNVLPTTIIDQASVTEMLARKLLRHRDKGAQWSSVQDWCTSELPGEQAN